MFATMSASPSIPPAGVIGKVRSGAGGERVREQLVLAEEVEFEGTSDAAEFCSVKLLLFEYLFPSCSVSSPKSPVNPRSRSSRFSRRVSRVRLTLEFVHRREYRGGN